MEFGRISKASLVWLCALLSAILAHALLPVGSPLLRSSGSPFSATTFEVSTVPARKSARTIAEEAADASSDANEGFGAAGAGLTAASAAGVAASFHSITAARQTLVSAMLAPILSGRPPARAPPIF